HHRIRRPDGHAAALNSWRGSHEQVEGLLLLQREPGEVRGRTVPLEEENQEVNPSEDYCHRSHLHFLIKLLFSSLAHRLPSNAVCINIIKT
uniref:Uncharacterized protein n=1 Tax=Gasterosteus aculeatus TaxID=69293 RepID=G3PPV8_GASAC